MVKKNMRVDREVTRSRHHMGYSFRLEARVISYAPSRRQDSTYHVIYESSRGALGVCFYFLCRYHLFDTQ